MGAKEGIAVGLNKGRVVATRKLAARPGNRKGRLGKRVKNIRELVRDVVGSAPYEKRLMELLKVGRDKRALKLAKRKVRRISRSWHTTSSTAVESPWLCARRDFSYFLGFSSTVPGITLFPLERHSIGPGRRSPTIWTTAHQGCLQRNF